jgi:hypothetical protein
MKLALAECSDTECQKKAFSAPFHKAGLRPSLAVSNEGGSTTQKRVALLCVSHDKDEATSSATTGLLLSVFQVDTQSLDASIPFEDLAYNPPISRVIDPKTAASVKPKDSAIRSTAVAITNSGTIMTAWVHQEGNGPASLWMRQYRLETCSP